MISHFKTTIALLSFVFFCLQATAKDSFSRKIFDPSKNPATVEKKITSFTTPRRTLPLAFEVGGRLEKISVDIGQTISGKAGEWDFIATLNTEKVNIELQLANTNITQAKQDIELLKKQSERLKQQLLYQKSEEKRFAKLRKDGISTDERVRSLEHASKISELNIKEHETILKQAENKLLSLQQQYQSILINKNRHQLKAPAKWVVNRRLAEPGQIIQAGQAILELLQVDTLLIDLYLNERETQALKKMKQIEINFPQSNHPSVTAKILNSSKQYFPQLKKRLIQLSIPGDKAPSMSGGIEVSLNLEIKEEKGTFQVPKAYVGFRYDTYFVQLENKQKIPLKLLRKEKGKYIFNLSQIPNSQNLIPFTQEKINVAQ